LCDTYHLEDKVLFQGPGNDRAVETSSTETETRKELTNTDEQRVQIVEKPKRKVTRPAYLDDYA